MGARIPWPLQRYRLLRRRASSGRSAPVPLLYSAALRGIRQRCCSTRAGPQGGEGVAARHGAGSRPPRYLFGDSDVASHRLRVLSEVFAESSRRFLSAAAPGQPNLAVDIGCGPGYTTRLVADVLRPLRTVGIDSSEAFIAEARRAGGSDVSYLVHDAAAVPFPVGPADLIYARFRRHPPARPDGHYPRLGHAARARRPAPAGRSGNDQHRQPCAVTLPDHPGRTAGPPGQ